MNHLELVQKAIRKSGSKASVPSTLVGAEGLSYMFSEWVSDAWADIQNENRDLWTRTSEDLLLPLSQGVDSYQMPGGLESVNLRTVRVDLFNNHNTSRLDFVDYEYWAGYLQDRAALIGTSGTPWAVTITPDNEIVVYPPPGTSGQVLRFDGVRDIDIFGVDPPPASNPVVDARVPSGLPEEYHSLIVWRTVMYYAQHFEDSGKLAEARDQYRAIMKRVYERFMPGIYVEVGHLYSNTHNYRHSS